MAAHAAAAAAAAASSQCRISDARSEGRHGGKQRCSQQLQPGSEPVGGGCTTQAG
jgi:hypothetical protein